jgi:hypothetical protein
MKRKLFGLGVVLIALILIGCSNPSSTNNTAVTITLLAIPGVTPPVTGATPVTGGD